MKRKAKITRQTKETSIDISVDLDGSGELSGNIPIPFFEHMLSHLSKYSLINIELNLKGDLGIDCHHSVEDSAIVLGQALQEALGEKQGIHRFGSFSLPMDEVFCTAAIDFSGRPYFKYSGPSLTNMGKFGIYDSELTLEFLHKLSIHAMMNLHIVVAYGENRHHIHEAIFKCLGFAMRQGISYDTKRGTDIPSTKGIIS